MRAQVDLEHVLHRRDEGGLGVGRDQLAELEERNVDESGHAQRLQRTCIVARARVASDVVDDHSVAAAQIVDVVVETLRRLARVPFEVEIDAARLRPSDIPFAAGRAERLQAAIGWAPVVPLTETLAMLLADARRHHAP